MKQIIISLLLITYSILSMTDKDLPHINPYQAGELYALMIKVDEVLEKNSIFYWAGWGTLLGAIRHKGLIPWDDDLDVAIFEDDIDNLRQLKLILQEIGLILLGIEKEGNVDYYKIFPTNGQTYEQYPWRYPFVDIFPMKKFGKEVKYSSRRLREAFNTEFLKLDEELSPLPLNKTQFGPMKIPIPHNASDILTRLYGNDWDEVAYAQYDHKEEKELERVQVQLVERAQVNYIMPTQ